ncbi:hypothetical protein C8Q75DRAFT_733163 [Abortiporus biennis]|nr:hypothetical protein C8Q75DRAFT_733163 [Abortiporus biennis]
MHVTGLKPFISIQPEASLPDGTRYTALDTWDKDTTNCVICLEGLTTKILTLLLSSNSMNHLSFRNRLAIGQCPWPHTSPRDYTSKVSKKSIALPLVSKASKFSLRPQPPVLVLSTLFRAFVSPDARLAMRIVLSTNRRRMVEMGTDLGIRNRST